LLPTYEVRIFLRRTSKRNWWKNTINQQEMIVREDLEYFGRHIWDFPVILGGHARHCKLILGKRAGQRTLPLPVLTSNCVAVPVKEGGQLCSYHLAASNKGGQLFNLMVK
jgi:hypothetical protein